MLIFLFDFDANVRNYSDSFTLFELVVDDRIVPAGDLEQISAAVANKNVVTWAAMKRVFTRSTKKSVVVTSSPKDVAMEPSGQTITMPVVDQLIVSMAAMERVLMAEQLITTVL